MHASFKFTELVIYMNIIRTSFLLALCEMGDKIRRSQADRELFEKTASDLRRHLSYGIEHVKHYLLNGDEQKRRNVRAWLDRGEIMLAADLRRDKPLREAFILALGDTVEQGKAGLRESRRGAVAQATADAGARALRRPRGPTCRRRCGMSSTTRSGRAEFYRYLETEVWCRAVGRPASAVRELPVMRDPSRRISLGCRSPDAKRRTGRG